MNGLSIITALAGSFKDMSPVSYVLTFFLLSLLPWAFLSLTSFLKINIVLSILRNALGANGIPSAAITSLVSFALTLHVMSPVGSKIGDRVKEQPLKMASSETEKLAAIYAMARPPIMEFLLKNSQPEHRIFFRAPQIDPPAGEAASGAANECKESLGDGLCLTAGEGFNTLVPAFIFSELSRAFSLGFLIFLPFLIVDVLVAVVLVGMGMNMLNPVSVSLPLKLLLLVATNGWFELGKALILGYR